VDRLSLEVWGARDHDVALGTEVLRFLDELVVVQPPPRLTLRQTEHHLDHGLVLDRLVGCAEGDGHAREATNPAAENQVRLVGGDNAERAAAAELVLDRAPHLDLESRLAPAIDEELDPDRLRGARQPAGAGEVVTAREKRNEEEKPEALHTTRLTRRPGTT